MTDGGDQQGSSAPPGGDGDGGRRRRRRRGARGPEAGGDSGPAPAPAAPPGGAPTPGPARERGPRPDGRDRGGLRPDAGRPAGGPRPPSPRGPGAGDRRGPARTDGAPDGRGEPRDRTQRPAEGRDRAPRPEARDRNPRPAEGRDRSQRPAEQRDRGPRPDPRDRPRGDGGPPPAAATSVDSSWDDDSLPGEARTTAPAVADDDGPAPAITLTADLPVDDPDDPDPSTAHAAEVDLATLGLAVVRVVGVQLEPAGRTYWCDAGDGDYGPGDRVLVDGERSSRVATVVTRALRRSVRERPGRRVNRKVAGDERPPPAAPDRSREVLSLAKQRAAALRLPIKVFRIEHSPGPGGRGGRLNLYFTTDERDRVDLRELVRDLGTTTGARIELRQVGGRDEAKQVGGIGSCGAELCCTTWLPEFVPVSIKMAKDQGLVLNPTKVTGQCGRLKCCLVYEQATYAEMRKGLPKLGKRVVTAQGEGRVVEVDVLRQRVRVGFGPGESVTFAATEVKPLFPPQAPGGRRPDDDGDAGEADADDSGELAPSDPPAPKGDQPPDDLP